MVDTLPITPSRVSHYRLIERLGRGAMGEVWLAEDTQLPRKVAVKLLAPHLAAEPDAIARLLREAQAAASVDHPAIVSVYEAGLADGRPFIVMQRAEGETLEQRLKRGPLPVAEAVDITRRIADALAEVHALGIVHRDLKPANIIIGPRGPKILDFGVAQLAGSPHVTAVGALVGTPLTMSPEQVRGHPVDNRADLWALGVILYEMLTGRSPFAAEHAAGVGLRVLEDQPPPPSELRPEVGHELDYVVLKLLRKEAPRRYARAEDLLIDLGASGPDLATACAPAVQPRIAVTYFEVLSGDPGDFYLAAGLTDDLIVDLMRVDGMQVASREDVRAYRDRAVPPRTLARELGVDYVLVGSVRRAGNRARISAQLARACDGATLWAERFDRTLDDLFAMQSEVSLRIVEALHVALHPGEREMLDRAPSRSPEAYGLYLRARELLDDRAYDSNLRAEELLKRALELDPDFAMAHAALAEGYGVRGNSWWCELDQAVALALPHAERALALDPGLVEAHLARAMIHRLRGETAELLAAAERILAMEPDCTRAVVWAAWAYMILGKPDVAAGVWEGLIARKTTEFYSKGSLAMCYELCGRNDDATRLHRQALEQGLDYLQRNPDNALARAWVGIELIAVGQVDAGIAQVEKALVQSPHDGRIRYNAACAFARAGRPERAIAEMKEGIKDLKTYASDWVKRDPDLAGLVDHPEFVRLFGRA